MLFFPSVMLLLLQIGLVVKGIDCGPEHQLGLKEAEMGVCGLLMAGDLFKRKKACSLRGM